MTDARETLRSRVSGRVRFSFFRDGALWYRCDDGWEFPVPVSDTGNTQGASPTFLPDDKAIVFMRWIRRAMAREEEARNEAAAEAAGDSRFEVPGNRKEEGSD